MSLLEPLNNAWDSLAYPWVLALAPVAVGLVWWTWLGERGRTAMRFSTVSRLEDAGESWSKRARHVIPVLRSLALLLLVICAARPRKADEMTRIQTEGVAIQLVVDRSGSMDQQDFVDSGGRQTSRLNAVKQVVKGFILGDGEELRGRPDDLVGLTVFARYPDTKCPLTRDHAHLIRGVDLLRVPRVRSEDGTAIGDALLQGVERIYNIGRQTIGRDDFKIKSRAVILLTDGEQNAGKHKPTEAAEAAKALGVKVYTIGAAPEFQEIRSFFGVLGQQRVPIDEKSLSEVAEMTGGKYFRARDAESLREIYAEIDRLERSTVDEQRYYQYEELAYKWIEVGGWKLPPPLLVVLVLLGLEAVMVNTRFRRIP